MTKNKHIDIVKRRLWCSGYAVSERSREADGFDLLVDGKTKVNVIGVRSPKELEKHQFSQEVIDFATAGGVLAVVATATFGRPMVAYAVNDKVGPVGARVAFGLPIKKENHGKKTKEVTPKGSGKEVKA